VAYVLDTSAIFVVLFGEPGYEVVADVLTGSDDVLLPFMALMELQYQLIRHAPPDEAVSALRLVTSWPAEVIESSAAWRDRAAAVKAPGGLSLGEAWIAALALLRNAVLIHRDPEFDSVPGLLAQKLPAPAPPS
jgi:predicted nucleic acid-binding protein